MTNKEDIKELKELILELHKRIEKLEKGWWHNSYPAPYKPLKKKKCPHCNGTGEIGRGKSPWDDSHPFY